MVSKGVGTVYISDPVVTNKKLNADYFNAIRRIAQRKHNLLFWNRIGACAFLLTVYIIAVVIIHRYSEGWFLPIVCATFPALLYGSCCVYFLQSVDDNISDKAWKEVKALTAPYFEGLIVFDEGVNRSIGKDYDVRSDIRAMERFLSSLGVKEVCYELFDEDPPRIKLPSPWLYTAIHLIFPFFIISLVAGKGGTSGAGGAGCYSGGAGYYNGVPNIPINKPESSQLTYAERNKIKQYLYLKDRYERTKR